MFSTLSLNYYSKLIFPFLFLLIHKTLLWRVCGRWCLKEMAAGGCCASCVPTSDLHCSLHHKCIFPRNIDWLCRKIRSALKQVYWYGKKWCSLFPTITFQNSDHPHSGICPYHNILFWYCFSEDFQWYCPSFYDSYFHLICTGDWQIYS